MINNKSTNLAESAAFIGTWVTRQGCVTSREELLVCEHLIDVYVNEKLVLKLVCTPSDLELLVLGRLCTEGIIKSIDDVMTLNICESGRRAKVFLNNECEWEVSQKAEPTCCTGNKVLYDNSKAALDVVFKKTEVNPEHIFALADEFARGSKIHRKTKGTHSCYLSVKGEYVFSCEDIGRHNAIDKCIGYMLEKRFNPLECILFTTGRVPTDMVNKAVAAGVPVLASKAVPTSEAIGLAREHNLNLICMAWPDGYMEC